MKLWYYISASLIFLAGLIWALENLIEENILVGIFGSIIIILLFFSFGFYLIKLNPKTYNKLTNISIFLILSSVIWILLVALYEFMIINPNEMEGIITIIFGIFPAGILVGISFILLIINYIINHMKNKKEAYPSEPNQH